MRPTRTLPILALLVCLAGETARAQATQPAEPTPAQAPEATLPTTALEVAARLDELDAAIISMESALPDIGALLKAKARLDAAAGTLADWTPMLPAATATGASPIMRERLEFALARLAEEIPAARRPLDRRVKVLEEHRATLKAGKDLLDAIRSPDKGDADTPEALTQRMRATSTRTRMARKGVSRALEAAVAEAQRASALQQQINEGLKSIEAARKAEEQATLTLQPEQPPIWKALPVLRGLHLVVYDNLTAALAMLAEVTRANQERWALLFLALAALVVATLRLRRAVITGDPQDRGLFVLHPVATAVLIWAVVGPDLFGIPSSSHDLLRIIVVVAAAWPLLGMIVPAAVQLPLRGLLILAIVATWLSVLVGSQSGGAAFFLVGAATLALLRMLDTGTRGVASAATPALRGSILAGIRFAGLLTAAGVLATVFGAVRLGQQLIEGVLLSAFLPVVLFVAAQTLRELWDQLIERALGKALRSVRNYPEVVRRRGYQLINLVLLLLVLPFVPRVFPFAKPLWEAAGATLGTKLEVGGISLSALDVVALLIGIAAAIVLAHFVRFVLDEEVMPRLPVAPGAASAATRLLYYLLLTVGLMLALAASGFELSQLTLVVSALGVGLGFGLQNIVSNFVSGVVLAFERPFQVGDLIAVEDKTGRVLTIGLRATNVKTLDGAEVIVPNSTFISGNVINWTLSDRMRRIDLPVGVAYGSDLRKVQEILREAIATVPELARNPEPVVAFTGFGESSLDFRILVWTPDADRMLVTTSDLAMAINEALAAAGIEIPFPQRDIHIRTQPQGAT